MNQSLPARNASARPAPGSASRRPAARIGWWLSLGNLAFAIALLVLIRGVSERWWLSTALVYLPRSPYLVPSLVLLPWTGLCLRRAVLINLGAALIIAGPVMGSQMNLGTQFKMREGSSAPRNPQRELCVVSCNVQKFRPRFELVLRELSEIHPDLVVFQEADRDHPLLGAAFEGWHVAHHQEFLVASRFPVRVAGTHFSEEFGRITAVKFEVDHPSGKFHLYDLHQTTPRYGLMTLKPTAILSESGHSDLDVHSRRRETEAIAARSFVESDRTGLPKLIVGDFNMPTDSSLFQACWGDLPSAFDCAGLGYGFTAPCHTRNRWPEGVPWARVDHILFSDHWTVGRCWTGHTDGSDHRLIAATLELR